MSHTAHTRSETRAFWIDAAYDRQTASDRISRFGAYVRDRAGMTAEWWDNPDAAAEWAVWIWQVATPPIMAPGYVGHHPRILSAQVIRSGWDGSLCGQVDVIIDLPVAPSVVGRWRGWSQSPFGGLEGPDERQATEGRYLLPHADASAPLDIDLSRLRPPSTYDDLTGAARAAVDELAATMNRAFTDLIDL